MSFEEQFSVCEASKIDLPLSKSPAEWNKRPVCPRLRDVETLNTGYVPLTLFDGSDEDSYSTLSQPKP